MNQLQFRGKLGKGTFLISKIGEEAQLSVAHVLSPEDQLEKQAPSQSSKTNVFLDSSSSSLEDMETLLSTFQGEPLFCRFSINYKAPFGKTLVLRDFHKNGNLQDVLEANDEIEELYLAYIIRAVLMAMSNVHAKNYSGLGIEPKQIEVGDDGDLVFPFYYGVKEVSAAGLVKDLINFKTLVRCLIKQLNFNFGHIDKSKYSNRFKDFLKSLFQNYGFEECVRDNTLFSEDNTHLKK
jgi:hypothetical protein